MKDLDRAIELNPKSAEAYFQKAGVYSKLDDTERMIENAKIAARLGSKAAQRILKENGKEW
jgi:tetratricopeptide (TPR) repeat protein